MGTLGSSSDIRLWGQLRDKDAPFPSRPEIPTAMSLTLPWRGDCPRHFQDKKDSLMGPFPAASGTPELSPWPAVVVGCDPSVGWTGRSSLEKGGGSIFYPQLLDTSLDSLLLTPSRDFLYLSTHPSSPLGFPNPPLLPSPPPTPRHPSSCTWLYRLPWTVAPPVNYPTCEYFS